MIVRGRAWPAALLALQFAIVGAVLAEDAPSSVGEQLILNATYSLDASLAAFSRDYSGDTRHVDDTASETWTRLQFESKSDLGAGLDLRVKGFAVLSTQEDERHGFFSEPRFRKDRPRAFDLTELKLRAARDSHDLYLGKMLLTAGVSNIFSPTNRFNNVDLSNPLHPLEMGVWAGRANFFIGDDTLSLAVVPWQDRVARPADSSRWLGPSSSSSSGTSLFNLGNWNYNAEERYAKSDLRNAGYLMHYSGSRAGFDFFGISHLGASKYAVLRKEVSGSTVTYSKETPQAFSLGGGISATSGAWSYYGEAIHQATVGNRDEDFLKYVIGVSYRDTTIAELLGFEEIMPILEQANEKTFGSQDSSRYVQNSRAVRLGRDTIFVRLGLKKSDKLSYSIYSTRNFVAETASNSADRSSAVGLGSEYKINDSLKFRADLRIFYGESNTQFGRWARNDHIEIGMTYSF